MSRNPGPWPEGTPAWVDLMVPDRRQAQDFYGGLFGWEFTEGGPGTGSYAICRKDGEAVAGIGELVAETAVPASTWTTYLAVDDADGTASRIRAAGGAVGSGPNTISGGRVAVARDPGGAHFGIWESGSHTGAAIVDEPSTMCGHEVLTRDFAAVRTFYTSVFDYHASDLSDADWTYCSLECNGVTVGGIGELPAEVPTEIAAHWMTYFASADTDAAARRAEELGGQILNEPTDAAFGRLAVLQGPAGEVFAVVTRPGQ